MRYRKKPVVIEAVQWTGENGREVGEFLGMDPVPSSFPLVEKIGIQTLEGVMTASPGDWIIRGVQGELYPCKPEIFEATYEPVADKLG